MYITFRYTCCYYNILKVGVVYGHLNEQKIYNFTDSDIKIVAYFLYQVFIHIPRFINSN